LNSTDGKVDRPFQVVALAMVGGFAFLAFHAVGRQLWMDDTHSTYHAFNGLGGVVPSLRTDSHPPLYFWFLSVWMGLGGSNEIWLRAPSIVFTLAAGAVLFRHAKSSDDPRLPWLYALFYLFNPVVVDQIQTVRPYPLLGLLAALSTVWYLGRAEREGEVSRASWLPYVAVNVLGTFTHYWFFFLLAGQAVGAALFVRGRAWRGVWVAIFVSSVPFFALWTSVLLDQTAGAPTSWLGRPGGFWLLSAPIQLLGGREFIVEARTFYAIVAVACILRLVPRPHLRPAKDFVDFVRDRRFGLLAAPPAVAMVLALLVSQITPIFLVRYTIVVAPAVAMLLGSALSRLGDRYIALVACGVFAGTSIHLRLEALERSIVKDSRAVTEYVLDRYQDGDAVVHITPSYAPTMHYLRALAPGRTLSQTVYPSEVAGHVGWRDAESMLADRPALRREAREVVESFLARPVSRVWFLADLELDSAMTTILREELEQEFTLVEAVPLEGWWVTEVQLYSPREGRSGGSVAPDG
jgi:hypothetical protein